MNNDRFTTVQRTGATTQIDAGLRVHMQNVYNAMSAGLVVTGLVAWFVASSPALLQVIFGNQIIHLIVSLSPLAIMWFGLSPRAMQRMSVGAVTGVYFGFVALMGVSLASIFVVYTGDSIARVFFITAGMFAATSIYGYTTQRDLSGLGSFLFMGLIGLIIASVVNIFMASDMMAFIISVAGVGIFTGLTAWDTQYIKESYRTDLGRATMTKMAFSGALSLYLNFINLFLMLLRLFGNSRN